MQSDSVRLLLTGNLRLGAPLRTALPLTTEARNLALDATTHAWRKIQDTAIDREVDVLILNGNTVLANQLTTTAEYELREGLNLLREAAIPVIIHPGETDPLSFWKGLLTEESITSDCVMLMSEGLASTCDLIRTSQNERWLQETKSNEHLQSENLIRFLTRTDVFPSDHETQVRWVMLESSGESTHALPPGVSLKFSQSSALWISDEYGSLQQHQISAPQPLSWREALEEGSAGCLLIELDQNQIKSEQIATASIGFHAPELNLSACDDWDDAALTLQNRLEELGWQSEEHLRLVTWILTENSPLSRQLLAGDDGPLLSAWTDSFDSHSSESITIHGFQPGGRFPLDHDGACSGQELAEALFEIEQSADQPDIDRLAAVWSTDTSSASLITGLRSDLNPAQIGRHAESVISQWLTQNDPENLPYENHSS